MNIFDSAKDKLAQTAREHPDQVEKLSDQALDRAGQAAQERTGGQHGDALEKARQSVDERIGTSGEPTQGGIVEQEGEPTPRDPNAEDAPGGY